MQSWMIWFAVISLEVYSDVQPLPSRYTISSDFCWDGILQIAASELTVTSSPQFRRWGRLAEERRRKEERRDSIAV